MSLEWRVRPAGAADEIGWRRLWKGYCDFYEITIAKDVTDDAVAEDHGRARGHSRGCRRKRLQRKGTSAHRVWKLRSPSLHLGERG